MNTVKNASNQVAGEPPMPKAVVPGNSLIIVFPGNELKKEEAKKTNENGLEKSEGFEPTEIHEKYGSKNNGLHHIMNNHPPGHPQGFDQIDIDRRKEPGHESGGHYEPNVKESIRHVRRLYPSRMTHENLQS
jgi:hypothetical protein